jgi:hypothetical protein
MVSVQERPPQVVRDAQAARAREALAHLDYERALAQLRNAYVHGLVTQTEIARWLDIKQPSVSQALAKGASVPEPVDGFSGATPFEVVQRYAAEQIGPEQLVDELARWPYARGRVPRDEVDDLVVAPVGTFDDVRKALSLGLLEPETYDAILDRMDELAAS